MNDCKTRSGRAFDRQAWTYDTARFGSHARGLYPVLLEQLVQIPHGSVLDVGCGNGFTANYLAGKGYDVYGIDASRQGIAIANRTGGGIPAVSSSAT